MWRRGLRGVLVSAVRLRRSWIASAVLPTRPPASVMVRYSSEPQSESSRVVRGMSESRGPVSALCRVLCAALDDCLSSVCVVNTRLVRRHRRRRRRRRCVDDAFIVEGRGKPAAGPSRVMSGRVGSEGGRLSRRRRVGTVVYMCARATLSPSAHLPCPCICQNNRATHTQTRAQTHTHRNTRPRPRRGSRYPGLVGLKRRWCTGALCRPARSPAGRTAMLNILINCRAKPVFSRGVE